MSRHYPGYDEARAKVQKMPLNELIDLIDDLEGRANLEYLATIDEVREEALRQLDREWTDPDAAKEIDERVAFHKAVGEALR